MEHCAFHQVSIRLLTYNAGIQLTANREASYTLPGQQNEPMQPPIPTSGIPLPARPSEPRGKKRNRDELEADEELYEREEVNIETEKKSLLTEKAQIEAKLAQIDVKLANLDGKSEALRGNFKRIRTERRSLKQD